MQLCRHQDNDGVITGDPLHDVRVIGVVTTVLLLGVVMIGLDFETKAQLVLLFILIISIVNFLVGTFLPPSEDKRRAGFVGYDGKHYVPWDFAKHFINRGRRFLCVRLFMSLHAFFSCFWLHQATVWSIVSPGRVLLARGSITSCSVISPRMRSCVTGSILIGSTLWSLRDDLANREAGRKSVFRSVFRENGWQRFQ